MVIVYLYIRRLICWLIQIIFKNINSVFSLWFYFFIVFFFSSFCRIQYAIWNMLFRFCSFLNSFKCFSRTSWCDRSGRFSRNKTIAKKYFTWLSEFNPLQSGFAVLYRLKHQKTLRFSDVFSGYRKATLGCNGLKL